MLNARIVIADPSVRQIVLSLLNGRCRLEKDAPAIVVVELTGDSACQGAATVRALRAVNPLLPVVAVSHKDGALVTQQAVRLGINDYFRLPDESIDFQNAVVALLSGTDVPPKSSVPQNALLGDSPAMISLRKYLARVALTDSSVLITGETGTGKELAAELIHKTGPRRTKPFVCVNSAALPETLLESELFGFEKGAFTGAINKHPGRLRMAHNGTILFDEIGDLSLPAQAKLLRAIESREVFPLGGWRGVPIDVRVIAATNKDLDAEAESGVFRRDLFYRLNVARIELPPLRARKQDIPRLVEHFVSVNNRDLRRNVECFLPNAIEALQSYDWPGNIRELRNVVEVSFINAASNQIGVEDLPEQLRRAVGKQTKPGTREVLVSTLQSTNWNISRVADELQCSRMTIYRKMAQHQISRSPQ
jgi:DNA-binding NtrC family response regulator